MPPAFKTHKNSAASVDISEVGQVGPFGSNPVPLSRAAEKMPELQDVEGKPLSGAALESAAAKWAEARGLEVKDVEVQDWTTDVRTLATDEDPSRAVAEEAARQAATVTEKPAAKAADHKGDKS